MKIDNILLDNLTAQAQASPRLRMNLDLRNSSEDTSQRMLNAIEPGSVVPVHRHRNTSETLVVLRGRVVEEYYDSDGALVECVELAAGGDTRSESDNGIAPCSDYITLNVPPVALSIVPLQKRSLSVRQSYDYF